MSQKSTHRSFLFFMISIIVIAASGCNQPNATEPAATQPPPVSTEVSETAAPESTEPPPTEPVAVVDPEVLYHDDFKNPATNWSEEKFDNYFIGYHEPEYYHIAINSPNYKTTVFIPDKPIFDNFDADVKAFTFAGKTAEAGDFRYGIAFRRSGDQYYAFTVSQRTKAWQVLKSDGNGLSVLKEGSDPAISDFDVEDDLKVDAQGSNFAFFLNGQLVAQAQDSDYTTGEIGFFVQSIDAPNLHIHYDEITIRKTVASEFAQSGQGNSVSLYADSFTNPATGWAERKFDDYFIGYHEPEYYHIAINSPNYKTSVFIPDKPIYDDFSVEVNAFTFAGKTAETGDFRYGIAFRRSGDQYYAFTISQRTKQWAVLKSTPNELIVLDEGTNDGINDFDTGDILRVDAKGSSFSFNINDEFVTRVEDSEYASGEIGFFVQSLDAPNLHIHYDAINVGTFDPRLVCTISALQMNIRSGPGTSFTSDTHISKGDVIQPVGVSKDGKWILIKIPDSDQQGWIANVPEYVACNASLEVLPVVE